MAKKKVAPQTRLSPENYIKNRARLLALGKCYINKTWRQKDLAHIVITRQHSNGNITAGVYLVDLLCLGTKESFYFFNTPAEKLETVLKEMTLEGMKMKEEPYTLLHNIILSANEFADDYGLSPCKEFRQLTRFILEEDDDKIELMEIHCGNKNGLPVYIPGMDDSEQKIKSVLATLEKTAGKGNYSFVGGGTDFIQNGEDFDDEFYELADLSQETEEMDLNEKMTQFHILRDEEFLGEKHDNRKMERLILLAKNLTKDLTKPELLDAALKKWEKAKGTKITKADEIETLFDENSKPSKKLKKEILSLIKDTPLYALEKIAALQKEHGLIPYLCTLEIAQLKLSGNYKLAEKKLKYYVALHPDFALLKIDCYATQLANSNKKNLSIPAEWNDYFANREKLHPTEVLQYITLLFHIALNKNDANELIAISIIIDTLLNELSELELNSLYLVSFNSMIVFVMDNYIQNRDGTWSVKQKKKKRFLF